MNEFSGRIIKDGRYWYYELMMGGEPICQDCGYEVMGNNQGSSTWGYEGLSTDKMAAVLLSYSCVPLKSTWKHHGNTVILWSNILHLNHRYHRLLHLVERHYKAFASEVVAELPDSWTMTRQWVRDWLAKAECKRRKEERESRQVLR